MRQRRGRHSLPYSGRQSLPNGGRQRLAYSGRQSLPYCFRRRVRAVRLVALARVQVEWTRRFLSPVRPAAIWVVLAALLGPLAFPVPAPALTPEDAGRLADSLGSDDPAIAGAALERLVAAPDAAAPALEARKGAKPPAWRARVRLALILAGKDPSGRVPEAVREGVLRFETARGKEFRELAVKIVEQGGAPGRRLLLVYGVLLPEEFAAGGAPGARRPLPADLPAIVRADGAGGLAEFAAELCDGIETPLALQVRAAAWEVRGEEGKALELLLPALVLEEPPAGAASEVARLIRHAREPRPVLRALEKLWTGKKRSPILFPLLLEASTKAGDFEAAFAHFETFAREFPAHLPAASGAVTPIFEKTHEWDRGAAVVAEAYGREPRPETCRLLARLQAGGGDVAKAAETLRRGLESYPRDRRLEEDLIGLAEKVDRPEAILPTLLGPGFEGKAPKDFERAARDLDERGHPGAALGVVRFGLRVHPAGEGLAGLLPELARKTRRFSEAAQVLRQAWEAGGRAVGPALEIAEGLRRNGAGEDAFDLLRIVHESAPSPEVEEAILPLARERAGEDREAAALVFGILAGRIRPDVKPSLDALREAAAFGLVSGPPARVLETLDRGLAFYPDDADLTGLRLRALVRAGRPKEAAPGLRERWRKEPGKWQVPFIRALSRAGLLRDEIASLRREMEAGGGGPPTGAPKPETPPEKSEIRNTKSEILGFLSAALQALKDRPGEIEFLDAALREREKALDEASSAPPPAAAPAPAPGAPLPDLDPAPEDAPEARLRLGLLLLDEGRPEDAARAFRAGAVRHEGDPRFLFLIAEADARAGKAEAAERAREEARAAAARGDPGQRARQGSFFFQEGLRDLAREEWDAALASLRARGQEGPRANVLFLAARVLEHHDQFRDAAARYGELSDLLAAIPGMAIRGVRAEDFALRRRYLLLLADPGADPDGLFALAERLYEGARNDPMGLDVAAKLHSLLAGRDRAAAAEKVLDDTGAPYRKRFERDPEDAQALNNLAWFYALCGARLEEGIRLSERSLEIEPDEWAFLDTLAEIRWRNGEPEKALEIIRRARRAKPREPYLMDQEEKFRKAVEERNGER